jgi:ribosomal protein L40E
MRCLQCGHDNPEQVKFCGECGTRIEGLCPGCGTSNPPTNKFCHQCGQALAPPPAPAARWVGCTGKSTIWRRPSGTIGRGLRLHTRLATPRSSGTRRLIWV